MIRGCCLLLLLSNLCKTVGSEVVLEQGAQPLAVQEGEEVTFQCRVTGGRMSSYWMYWYRKEQQGPLTWIYREGDHYGEGFQGRFVGKVDSSNNRFTLRILRAELRDRAVYYCASSTTTTALLFGSGTRLTVEPKNQEPSPPSVFVVKSANAKPSDGNKLTAACLVKDFFPNNVKVNMSGEADTVYKSKEGILSSNGKYSMMQVVKVEPNEEVGCYVTQEGWSYNRTQAQSATTPAPINTTQVCESSNSTVEEPNMEKVNMLSVTVLGLRVLLAKSIAFNMLMTVKLFIF